MLLLSIQKIDAEKEKFAVAPGDPGKDEKDCVDRIGNEEGLLCGSFIVRSVSVHMRETINQGCESLSMQFVAGTQG